MGLDISAYSKLVQIDTLPDVEEWEDKYWMQDHDATCYTGRGCVEMTNRDFPGRADGIIPNAVYRRDGEEISFRAGSYSGYNAWRDTLSRLMLGASAKMVWSNAAYKGKPFYELIDFSDCEGYIGPTVAAKLAADFAEYQDKADAFCDVEWGEHFVKLYNKWHRAFELAADGGLVEFH